MAFRSTTRRSKLVDIVREKDVVVVGGGAAGVASAISAARSGASVLLVEKNGFLGGTMTAATLGGICGLYSLIDGWPVQLVFGFAEEVRQCLSRAGGLGSPTPWLKTASLPYDPFRMRVALEDLALANGVDVLLHAELVEVVREGARVSEVIIRSRGSEIAVRGTAFIDCTGDAVLCHQAGGGTEMAFPGLQLPSAMFRMGGVDTARIATMSRETLHECLEQAVQAGFELPRTAGGIYSIYPGIAHLNITKVSIDGRAPNPFDPWEMTAAEREGRRQIQVYLEAFRRYVPGFEEAYVLDQGTELGIRESRRVVGDYQVTTSDVLGEARFDDAIGISCWPVEDHASSRTTRWVWLRPGAYSQIPLRCLLPEGLENVVVAGRCLSASHEAQAALRVTANCFTMGQAAGVAAACAPGGQVRSVPYPRVREGIEAYGQVIEPVVP